MEAKTLAALIAGAEKWERNAVVTLENVHIHADSCALCKLFLLKNGHCGGCPVNDVTVNQCDNSPWLRADDALFTWEHASNAKDRRNAAARFRRAAKAEAKFLRSLIPADAA